MRTYRDQFDPEMVSRIDALTDRIERLSYPTGPARYYGLDLAACLRAGALAGSLVVASSFMELYIRGLVVRYSDDAQKGWARPVETERELDNMKGIGFQKLVHELLEADLFDPDCAEKAKELYASVRIPANHGLPSRFFPESDSSLLVAIFGAIRGNAGPVSMREFEEFIEEESLTAIEAIVDIIEKNQYGTFA